MFSAGPSKGIRSDIKRIVVAVVMDLIFLRGKITVTIAGRIVPVPFAKYGARILWHASDGGDTHYVWWRSIEPQRLNGIRNQLVPRIVWGSPSPEFEVDRHLTMSLSEVYHRRRRVASVRDLNGEFIHVRQRVSRKQDRFASGQNLRKRQGNSKTSRVLGARRTV